MAITKVSSTSSTTALASAIPAGLGYITETSFYATGIDATGNDTASYQGRNATTIAYGNNIWVMFGTKGAHAWSHNGTDWYSGRGPIPINQQLYDLDFVSDAIYAGGKWVAVTRLGRIFTGTDQHTWTERTSPFGGTYINRVAYGNGYYVAVADNGKFAYSTDAVTWTLSSFTSSFPAGYNIYAVNYIAGSVNKWVMGGTNGRHAYSTSNTPLAWTANNAPGQFTSNDSNSNINDIQYNSGTGLIVMVGNYGRFATSTDGVTWTTNTAISGNPQISRVWWVGSTSQWVALTPGSSTSYWSSSGTSWTTSSITYPVNYFGSNNNTVPFATDGSTKIACMTYTGGQQVYMYTTSTSFTNLEFRVVNFGWITVNDSSAERWQPTALPTGHGNLEMIAKGTSKIMAFLSFRKNFGQFHFMESLDDGVTWYSAKIAVDPTGVGANAGIGSGPTSGNSTKVQISFLKTINGIWFMGCSNGAVYTSIDGETWVIEYSVGSDIPVTVEYGNGYYIGISTNNSYFYRTSGVPNRTLPNSTTWGQQAWNSAGSGYCKFIKWVGRKWVAGWSQEGGTLRHSANNGINWTTISRSPGDDGVQFWGDGGATGNSNGSWASTSTSVGNDYIFDYNNGVAIAAGRSNYTSNGVVPITVSNNLSSWAHFYGINGRTYSNTDSGYLYHASGEGFTANGFIRHSNANFGNPTTDWRSAFNNAFVPVVQVFDNIPMAFIGYTSYRGTGAYGGGSHGYIQWRNGMNISNARGYFTRNSLGNSPVAKFIQVGNRFLSIGYADSDQGTQPRTSNAGYWGIYEVPAIDVTKI